MLAAEEARELVLPLDFGGAEHTVVTVACEVTLASVNMLEFALEIPDVPLEIEPKLALVYFGNRGRSIMNILNCANAGLTPWAT